jgi:putative acetyltransferase
MKIRAKTDSDVASIATLFYESVHQIASQSYTPQQLKAWAPESPDLKQWQLRLARLETLVADFEGVLAGFISYTVDGHIEFLYTAPAFTRQGVASKLFEAAVQILQTKGVTNLSTEASIVARPFFEFMGFSVVEEQVVERNGVQLRRFAMTRVSMKDKAQA